jgi:hypothetical protein
MEVAMKRLLTVLLCGVLSVGVTACGVEDGTPAATEQPSADLTTEQWFAPDNTVTACFSEDDPEDATGVNIDTYTIHIGQTAEGKDIFALLRVPLKSTWLADEVHSARLFLKLKEGVLPAALKIGLNKQLWSFALMSRVEARAAIDDQSLETIAVRAEANDWISVDVTSFVKSWLSGDVPNYGVALFGVSEGEESVFVSADWVEDGEYFPYPYLEVSGAAGNRARTFGKFGYTETPLPGAEVDQGGNCMSYALRDTNMILIDGLGADFDTMNLIYEESGEDAVADYFAKLVADYVEAHKDSLQISSFRMIDGFDAEIDAAKEYRLALRVGCKVMEGEKADLDGNGNFDYHFWMQLNDGRWAQKFPLDTSEIIPCTGPGISPGNYPWDSAMQWNIKFQGYYTSKTIYFAATKDSDAFTRHLGK